MRIENLISEAAEQVGAKVAVVSGRRHHSFSDLNVRSSWLAASLAARGVARGDRAIVYMDNSFEAVCALFAVWRAGAVACPLDPAIGADALATVLRRTSMAAVLTEARLGARAAVAMRGVTSVKVVVLNGGDRSAAQSGCLNFEDAVAGIGPAAPIAHGGDGADAAVLLDLASPFGETQPLSHDDLLAAASKSATPGEAVVVVSAPIWSHYGLYQLLTGIRAGATQVVQSSVTGRGAAFNAIDRLQADAREALSG